MNKRPELTQATRQRFVDAFRELYQKKPVEKIMVKELAALAGYNRVTFYQYFRDAYDILECLENELLNDVQRAIKDNLSQGDMFQQFEQVFDALLKDKPELVTLLLTGGNYSRTLERCKAAIWPMLIEAFGIKSDDWPRQAVLEFYLSGVVSLLKFKTAHEETIQTQEMGRIIKYVLQNGILPQLR